jgi:hypothetical protein
LLTLFFSFPPGCFLLFALFFSAPTLFLSPALGFSICGYLENSASDNHDTEVLVASILDALRQSSRPWLFANIRIGKPSCLVDQ